MKKFITIVLLIMLTVSIQAIAKDDRNGGGGHGFGFNFGFGYIIIPSTGTTGEETIIPSDDSGEGGDTIIPVDDSTVGDTIIPLDDNTGGLFDNDFWLDNLFDDLFDDIDFTDIPIPIEPPVINYPAEWEKLQDQHINKGSPDYTVVYPNIKEKCNDPDDVEKFSVLSMTGKYDLFFYGTDLIIKNLDPNYKGKNKVIVSCNGVSASFNLYIKGYTGNYPARWNDLHDVTIAKGTKDKTMIYENLAKQCNDPDDAEIIKVKWNGDFKLYFSQYDLLITKLDKELTGTFPIQLDCNGVKTSFNLIISEYKKMFYENELTLSSIYIDDADHVRAGDLLPIYFTMKNSGDDKLENIQVTALIAELGTRANIGPFDVKEGQKVQKQLMLEIPEWTPAGTYYVAIYSSNDDVRRIKYREIIVTE